MIESDPYVTIADAAQLCGVDAVTICRWRDSGKLAVRAGEKSANGRAATLVRVASLPTEAQVRYWQGAMTPSPSPSPSGGEGNNGMNLAAVPKASLDEALRRLPFVLRALEIIASRDSVSASMDTLAAEVGETARTLYRWVAQWQQDGMPGLLPKWGQTRGTFTALSTAIQEIIKYEYLSPSRPSVTTVYRRVQAYCREPGIMLPAPCAATINKYIKSLPLPARVLAREGPRAWRAECEPKIHRDFSDLKPGEIWCGDHRELDVFVRLSDEAGAKILRPWITSWMDLRTRACMGWHLALVPTSHTIALALRQGLLRFGVPKDLYADNGKDFQCHYLNGKTLTSKHVGLSDEARAVLSAGILTPLGVTVRHATAYTPWAKPIEPWHHYVLPVWEQTLPGWCGRDNKQRPEKLQAEIQAGALLTFEALRDSLAARIEEYHRTAHGGAGMDGATPLSLWQDVKIERPDPRVMDIMMMRHKPAKVYAQGIKLFGSPNAPRFYRHEALHLLIGHTVDVSYDPQDLGSLVVYRDRKFVCVATNAEAMTMRPSEQQMKAVVKMKRDARRAAEAYSDQRKLLMSPDEALRRVVGEKTPARVYALRPDPPAQAGTIAAPPTVALLAQHQAAAALAASHAQARAPSTSQALHPSGPAASRPGRGARRPAASLSESGTPTERGLTSPAPPAPDAEPTWDDVLALAPARDKAPDHDDRDEIYARIMEA